MNWCGAWLYLIPGASLSDAGLPPEHFVTGMFPHVWGRNRRQQRTCGTCLHSSSHTHRSLLSVMHVCQCVKLEPQWNVGSIPDWEPIEWADCGPSTLSRVSSGAHCRPAVYECTACPHSRCGLQACPQEAMWGDPQNCCGLCIGTLSSLPTLPDSYSYCYPLLANTGTFARMGWEYFHQNQNCNHSGWYLHPVDMSRHARHDFTTQLRRSQQRREYNGAKWVFHW